MENIDVIYAILGTVAVAMSVLIASKERYNLNCDSGY